MQKREKEAEIFLAIITNFIWQMESSYGYPLAYPSYEQLINIKGIPLYAH